VFRSVLRAKVHRARVTEANLEYEGSLTLDENLMKAAGMVAFERVSVSNLENGERFDTYVIPGEAGSGMVCLNGPTARKAVVGDRIIIFCYAYMSDEEFAAHTPTVVHVDVRNRQVV